MSWSGTEIGVLARAVSRAPSVHHSRPWTLEAHGDQAELVERVEVALPRHDPAGRDRMVSCGAALANLELAVRALGRRPAVALFPAGGRPDLVAKVVAAGREDATAEEVERYSAVFRRRSYRAPFSLHPVPPSILDSLGAAAGSGAQARAVRRPEDAAALAELLRRAAAVLREDRVYQRELTAWTAQFPEPLQDVAGLPWAALAHDGTRLPDSLTLAGRLRTEGLLVVLTPGDGRRDHLLAGLAMERIWLAALTEGLVGSVLAQPLHVPEVRAGLADRLGLPGHPQVILRFGYPVTATPVTLPSAVAAGPR
ncbi:nitroreductase family protein [Amycolatopsis acidiphila]|uniref:Nitroreductase domain-containing protein n=1 Tax=Amycolatopsis acidiphila TaxID=715473 RepID=A0A557ZZ25_9PSEU|nr:nitroreductase family protein [Amycolatopsis acidiphila]TVT17250.1 hypothetical protein FNH06_32125 [Amycolatopsis acidiphila]UIJ62939.1 nitroreductase family protein [Amycolatopsis acidiphila]GHG65178.1 NAD(P)H nitroreductase [Amycolatopsis acidiphila]